MAPMDSLLLVSYALSVLCAATPQAHKQTSARGNTTYFNPIFPGSYPDPSCIFVEEWDDTFFCASSSFNIFPGIPIHASRDLLNWEVVSHVLNRGAQLPELAKTNGSTSGIWAPAIRYHKGTFYVVTTLVHDKLPADDPKRWDNIIFKTQNPFKSEAWSDPVHFSFNGYDTSPFWDEDGTSYVTGAHYWRVGPGIWQHTIDLETGELGEGVNLWNGTGGLAPEGPHIYRKDGYYYLMIAEGGTGVDHMETIARSKNLSGPYEPNPANPILTNANTTEYFQTVGHADIFQDKHGNWWGVALSTRSGPEYITYPMGRETVMVPAAWEAGEWPVFDQVKGKMSGPLPPSHGHSRFTKPDDTIVEFAPHSEFPKIFIYWRTPRKGMYTISEPGHPYSLALTPSDLNLTAYDGNYAATGQTFIGVRQTDTLFTYSVNVDFEPKVEEEEAGVSVFLTQNHHIDLGIVNLRNTNASSPTSGSLTPHFRFRAESSITTPAPVVEPVPDDWLGKQLTLEIKAFNSTHYSLSAGPASSQSEMKTIAYAGADLVSWGFTGTLIGAYATNNGHTGATKAYFSKWKYTPQAQFIN